MAESSNFIEIEKFSNSDLLEKDFYDTTKRSIKRKRRVQKKNFQCEVCKKMFKSRNHLNDHVRTHTGEKPYICEICNKSFSQKTNLKTHGLRHTGERRFSCHICPKKFTYKHHFLQHSHSCTGENSYECEICGKKFTNGQIMKKHMRLHSEEKPFTCKFCEENKCCECSESFKSENDLQQHIQIHKLLKSFICYQCEKEFTRASDLILHLRSCMGKMSYDCEKEKRNMQKDNHELSSRFVCYQCEKRFTEAYDLIIHLRTCICEKLYTCSTYGSGFDNKEILRKHHCDTQNSIKSLDLEDNIHGKKFSAEKNLIEDNRESSDIKNSETNPDSILLLEEVSGTVKLGCAVENVTQKEHFPCKVCQKVFTQKCLLNEHMFTHATVKQSGLIQYELSFECEFSKEELSDECGESDAVKL